jgi:hypothetical protein
MKIKTPSDKTPRVIVVPPDAECARCGHSVQKQQDVCLELSEDGKTRDLAHASWDDCLSALMSAAS